MSLSFFKAVATMFLSGLLVATSAAQSASPETLVQDFVNAWNSHDGKVFDRLFIEDAIWVPVAEARTEGRKNIVKDFAEVHATWAKFVEDGKEVPGIDRAMVIVAVKEADGWKIATGQITKQHEGA